MGTRELLVPCMLLCSFGFFKETLPSEPFLTLYLVYYKNISEEVVTNEIYPTWTYSYMVALIPIFLFTDALRYKPIIILEGCSFLATYALLLWASGVALMRLMQMFYALATASEIAYYSYIYAVVSSEHYQQVSSYTRTAVLIGNFVAGTLGQLLYSFIKNDDNILYHLHVISMSSVALATTLSLFLPKADSSTYFHRRANREEAKGDLDCDIQMVENCTQDAKTCSQIAEDNTQVAEHCTQVAENCTQVEENDTNVTEKCSGAENCNHLADICIQEAGDCTQQAENCTKATEDCTQQVENCNNKSGNYTQQAEYCSKENVSTFTKQKKSKEKTPLMCLSNQNQTTAHADDNNTWRNKLSIIWSDFRTSYNNKQLLKWSLWWAFATCGSHQVSNFVQTLWQVFFNETDSDTNIVYNGGVVAASTLAGAMAAFCIMFTKLNWDIFGEIFIGIVSIVDSVLLVTMGTTQNIWLCYGGYIIFRASYQLVKTIATYQIAKHLTVQRYGLVFGCNTFVAAVLQSLLTLIVVDHNTLSASPRVQFIIYGGCFFILGLLFCCKAVYTMTVNGWRWSWRNRYGMTSEDETEDKAEDKTKG